MLKNLKINRAIAFIDLETTGLHPHSDKIIEISILKIQPDGHIDYRSHRVNPGVPIPVEATAVHRITDEDVAKEPLFNQYAKGLCDFLDGCDISGFNLITFDLPFLETELKRAGISFSREGRQLVDSMVIYHQKESYEPGKPRNLKAAYLRYCGKELEDAHGAEKDVTASAEILDGMVEKHNDLPQNINGLDAFCKEARKNYIDLEGRFVWVEGEATFSFGKYSKLPLKEIAAEHPDYLRWMLGQDFSPEIYEIIENALDNKFPQVRIS